ncbi:C6 transcription factor SndA [Penicillium canescens]|uniref:C6 transcription factor SndA n=1 Tax=Penicillium canescens TaxID=5083 RepID=A0AAD6IAM7_PENCN|nr:C6 transcription factor SndA [Penicillium canescens]KAJ6060090.1 C6 transcription factor SndA [Penicillium canescens]
MMIDTYLGLRPLAPRTSIGASGGGGAGTQSLGGGDDKDRRIRRSSTACRDCQRRRTKCSGHPKCDECRVHNRECFFDKANDRRRKCFARRTQDQLHYYRRFTEDLISHFPDGDGATVQLIVDTIRSGADNQNLRELLIRLDKAAETEEDPNNQVLRTTFTVKKSGPYSTSLLEF